MGQLKSKSCTLLFILVAQFVMLFFKWAQASGQLKTPRGSKPHTDHRSCQYEPKNEGRRWVRRSEESGTVSRSAAAVWSGIRFLWQTWGNWGRRRRPSCPAQFWWHLLQMHSLYPTHACEHVHAHAHTALVTQSHVKRGKENCCGRVPLYWNQSHASFFFSVGLQRKCCQLRRRRGDTRRPAAFPSHLKRHQTWTAQLKSATHLRFKKKRRRHIWLGGWSVAIRWSWGTRSHDQLKSNGDPTTWKKWSKTSKHVLENIAGRHFF